MSKVRDFFKSPHIQIALAIGFSIIVLAYVSKRILSEPMGKIALAIPPFIGTIFEIMLGRYKESKICTAWYWVVAILASTGLIILFHFT